MIEVLVGFAQTDITPEVGAVIPGYFRKRISTGVHDPLHATACVISDGQTAVAIVSVERFVVEKVGC